MRLRATDRDQDESHLKLETPVILTPASKRMSKALVVGGLAIAFVLASPAAARLVLPGVATTPLTILSPDGSGKTDLEPAIESFKRKEYDNALRKLTAAWEKHRTLPPPRIMLARLLLSEPTPQIQPARILIEQTVNEDAKNPAVFITLGNISLLENRVTDAQLAFEKSTAILGGQADTVERKKLDQSDTLEGLALVWEQRQKWDETKKVLEAWLKLDPNNGRARQRLGIALFHLKDLEGSFAELDQAAKTDTELASASVTMGILHSQKGEDTKADQWFRKAVAEAPEDARVRSSLASWLLRNEKFEEASQVAERAHVLDPKSSPIRQLQGMIAMHEKRFEDAEKIFEELFAKTPGDFTISNQLAMALAEQPDNAKQQRALQYAEINARQYQRSPEALATLGRVYYRIGRLEEAERALEAAANLTRGRMPPDIAYFLAFCYADRGQLDKTKDLLNKALAVKGTFVFRKEAQEWVNRMAGQP